MECSEVAELASSACVEPVRLVIGRAGVGIGSMVACADAGATGMVALLERLAMI